MAIVVRFIVLLIFGFLWVDFTYVYGADCTTGEGCRASTACKTGGVVYCCPSGGMLIVNGTSGVCSCNTSANGLSCSGGAQLGLGGSLLPLKPADKDCLTDAQCNNQASCQVGSSRYCCIQGYVSVVSSGDQLRSCDCQYDKSGSSCKTYNSAPSVTSSSGLACVLLSLLVSGLQMKGLMG